MTPEQIEILEGELYLIETRDHPFRAVHSDYRNPSHPIIQLDGDFTVNELRQIVAACDAVMGRTTDDLPPAP
jgi:hypothetical protein